MRISFLHNNSKTLTTEARTPKQSKISMAKTEQKLDQTEQTEQDVDREENAKTL